MRERFARLATRPDHEVDLAEAALLIAAEEYPRLDVQAYLGRIDAMAAAVHRRVEARDEPERIVEGINQHLFAEEAFAGNTRDYYDPRNSYLNDVLDRKLGIPITLAVIYIEVGRRLGLPLDGVSFPGHFLVKYRAAHGEVVLDPFNGGVPLTPADVLRRLERIYGASRPPARRLAQLLSAAPRKDVLLRMLRNLKQIHLRREDFRRALSAADRIVLLAPQLAAEVRDRGAIHHRLECFQAALQDYERYLSLVPEAPDADPVSRLVARLRRLVARLN